MPLQARKGISKEVAAILTDILVVKVRKYGEWDVISAAEVAAMIRAERLKEELSCSDVTCAAEIGGAIGAKLMVTGNLGQMGSRVHVKLDLYDSEAIKVISSAAQSVKNDEDLYEDAILRAISELFGRPPPGTVLGPAAVAPAPTAPRVSTVGEIAQPNTMLVWMQCPLHQKWDGTRCKGDLKGMLWHLAKKACPAGYRLPTRAELVALLDRCDEDVDEGDTGACDACEKSQICSSLFGADRGGYWTSTLKSSNAGYAWAINFGNGDVEYREVRDYPGYVRCLRRAR